MIIDNLNRFEDNDQIDLENLEPEVTAIDLENLEYEIDLEYTNRQTTSNNTVRETRNKSNNVDLEVVQEEGIAKQRSNKKTSKSSHTNTKRASMFVLLIVKLK